MAELVFVKQGRTSRGGKYANCKLVSQADMITGAEYVDRYTQVGEVGSGDYTIPLCSLTIEEFEKYFEYLDIEIMKNNGVLNYYPEGYNTWGSMVSTYVAHKYPIFSAKVYKKYGVKKDPKGGALNE